jgi:hypothetical protein
VRYLWMTVDNSRPPKKASAAKIPETETET